VFGGKSVEKPDGITIINLFQLAFEQRYSGDYTITITAGG
jgi:hypothetical protein